MKGILLAIAWLTLNTQAAKLQITDYNEEQKLIKASLQATEVKFIKPADTLKFLIYGGTGQQCDAIVKRLEPDYITFFVENLAQCWDQKDYLRRGTALKVSDENFQNLRMQGSMTQDQVKERKVDYLNQLNNVNIYLYSFDLKKQKIESEYERRIRQLKVEKMKAIQDLYQERKEKSALQIRLRAELERTNQANRYFNK